MQPAEITLILNESFHLYHTWNAARIDQTEVVWLTGVKGETKLVRGVRFRTTAPDFLEQFRSQPEGSHPNVVLPTFHFRRPSKYFTWRYAPLVYYHLHVLDGSVPDRAGICMPRRETITATKVTPLASTHAKYGTLVTATADLTPMGDPYLTVTPRMNGTKALKQAREFLHLRAALLDQVQDTSLADYL